ncbi:MAG: nitroreductase family protein [Bacteroidales bacterium]|nr:nitroreductase family protein [Bacteroidales bacterium]
MKKPAPVQYQIHTLLTHRWSPRAFSSRKIPVDKIKRLFEAARWAPSSSNDQEWRFIIGFKEDETHKKIFDTLVEFNQLWAGEAYMLVLICGQTISKKTDKPSPVFSYDVGQAVALLSVQATHEELFVHQMGGFDKDKARKLLELPAEIEPLAVMAIGYPGDASKLHPNLQPGEKSERVRNNFDTFVFTKKYGEPSGLFDDK